MGSLLFFFFFFFFKHLIFVIRLHILKYKITYEQKTCLKSLLEEFSVSVINYFFMG